jgi:AraC family transcriptional regulator
MYTLEIQEFPARRIAAMPHLGPYPEITQAFAALAAVIEDRGLFKDIGAMVAVYYDDPATTPAPALRSHAGFEVLDTTRLDPPLESLILPAGRHAILRVTGPYTDLPAAYTHLFQIWLPRSGELPSGSACFEIYRNSPMTTAAKDLITEICLPLANP